MSEKGFLNFSIFLLFFSKFSCSGLDERNSRLKFFSLFLGLSHPVLAKNNTEKGFFDFFCYFFRNFLARVKYERNSGLKFFSLFLSPSNPVLAKNNAGKGFFIFFLIFWPFLSEFSCPGLVWTEFETNIFFFSFSASLNPFWIEIMVELSFLIFLIFLLFFLEFRCLGRVWTEFGNNFFFLFLGLSHSVLAK